jgi:hypothetical protein
MNNLKFLNTSPDLKLNWAQMGATVDNLACHFGLDTEETQVRPIQNYMWQKDDLVNLMYKTQISQVMNYML